MKVLSIAQVILTLVFSYLITSYIYADLNPFNLSEEEVLSQITEIGISLLIQFAINKYYPNLLKKQKNE